MHGRISRQNFKGTAPAIAISDPEAPSAFGPVTNRQQWLNNSWIETVWIAANRYAGGVFQQLRYSTSPDNRNWVPQRLLKNPTPIVALKQLPCR